MAARPLLLALLLLAFASGVAAPGAARAQRTAWLDRFEQSRAPESLKEFVRKLPPAERRLFLFRIGRLSPEQRTRFARAWDRMSDAEREERRKQWLGGGPRDRGKDLRRRFDELSEEERAEIRETLRDLRPGPRERLGRAIRNWDELTPAQRRKVSRHLGRLRRLSQERRERMHDNRELWEDMDRGRREHMRKRLRHFRGLSAEAQEALVKRRFGDRSEAERARILEGLRRGEPPG